MKVGLFDHIDRSDRAYATQLDERLEFAQAADEAGFWCLHVAEHHASPLNMVRCVWRRRSACSTR